MTDEQIKKLAFQCFWECDVKNGVSTNFPRVVTPMIIEDAIRTALKSSAPTEALTLEQQWREWVNEGDVTEDAVRAGAKVIAASPLIDAPKLSHNEWMGLSRAILEAAFAVSPLERKP